MNSTMTPIDWAKRPFQKYADFTGRAPRAEYWWYYLAVIIAYVITTILDSLIGSGPYGIITGLFALAILVPTLAVGVRRLHDTNHSGWWLLICLVPLIGLVLIYFLVIAGDAGDNDYGPDPYGDGGGTIRPA